MLAALLTIGVAHSAILFGGEYVPVGIGALAWSDEGEFSGTLSGEFDGLIRPPLTVHGGWAGKTDALTASFGLVRFANATFAATSSYQGVGGTRLELDYRRYLFPRQAGQVNFYGTGGGWFLLPNAADTDDGYTPEEQSQADELSGELRARIGGVGGQLGVAAQYILGDARGRPAVAVGLRYGVRLFRGQASNDEGYRVSTVVWSEAALVVDFTR